MLFYSIFLCFGANTSSFRAKQTHWCPRGHFSFSVNDFLILSCLHICIFNVLLEATKTVFLINCLESARISTLNGKKANTARHLPGQQVKVKPVLCFTNEKNGGVSSIGAVSRVLEFMRSWSCSRSVIDCSKTYILGKELRKKVVWSEKDCQKTNKQVRQRLA